MLYKGVVGKQASDLVLFHLCFNKDKRSCAIDKGTTHEHRPVCKKLIHECSMFSPICLFAYRFAVVPGGAWSEYDCESGFHAFPPLQFQDCALDETKALWSLV